MTSTHPYPVTPGHLRTLKRIAEHIAIEIAKDSGKKPLSAFKRLDALAVGLGYRGGSDMIQAARQRAQQQRMPLQFSVEHWLQISRAFAERSAESLDEWLLTYVTSLIAVTGSFASSDNCRMRKSLDHQIISFAAPDLRELTLDAVEMIMKKQRDSYSNWAGQRQQSVSSDSELNRPAFLDRHA